MIELRINGETQRVDPGTMEELQHQIARHIPSEHGVCRLLVNGSETSDTRLGQLDLIGVRDVSVESAPLSSIAHDAVSGTVEWIGRICGVLDSIADDYRLGREAEGSNRLASAVDALQVLVNLLQGIRTHAPMQPTDRERMSEEWEQAERELNRVVEGLHVDLQSHDCVALADRTGYALPRCLERFRRLLGEVST